MKIPKSLYRAHKDKIKAIQQKLAEKNLTVKIISIQIGMTKTRYIFQIISSSVPIGELKLCSNYINSSPKLGREVNIVAPFCQNNQLAVEIERFNELLPWSKKALLCFLKYHHGIIPEAFLIRKYYSDYRSYLDNIYGSRKRKHKNSRLEREMNYPSLWYSLVQLSTVGCVKMTHCFSFYFATISSKYVDEVLPKSLGWED